MADLDGFMVWLEQYVADARQPALDDLAAANSKISRLESDLTEGRAAITALLERLRQLEAPPKPPLKPAPGGLVSASLESLGNIRKHGPDWVFSKVAWANVERVRGVHDWSATHLMLEGNLETRVSLRVQAGGSTPQYLKDLTGPVLIHNAARKIDVTTAKWWTDEAHEAWAAMIASAGRQFDANPQVVLVTADLPMGVFSEPFILGSDPATGIRLHEMGLTLEKQVASIKRCVADTVAAFPTTRVELPIHKALQYPKANGIGFSWEAGRDLALDLHREYGHHVAFTDYGLGVDNTFERHAPAQGETIENTDDVYTFLYLLAKAGYPTGYQLTPKGATTPADYLAMATNIVRLGGWWGETSGWGSLGSNIPMAEASLRENALIA